VIQPAWDDPESKAGTMIRGALWLLQVVGEGGTFTKNELRTAFPGISQIDRRIRDLRDYGWILHSSTEDASLLAEDQRFVKAGVPVWDPHERRQAAPRKAISSKDRQTVLIRDGYMCTLCGIAGAEPYPDDPVMTAVVAVSRRSIRTLDGRETETFVTECKRCSSGRGASPIDERDVLLAARDLSPGDRRRLIRWMERGRRGGTELDRAWAAFLRVPIDKRHDVTDQLRREQ
jgi:5-methylcytosine-specific restriction endonuclease McrA